MMDNASRVEGAGLSPRNMRAAGLLCFFLGGFSAHRFYVGKQLTGAAQVTVCAGGPLFAIIGLASAVDPLTGLALPMMVAGGIWILVDFITIVSGKFKDVEGRVLRRFPMVVEESAPATPPPRPQPRQRPQPQPTQSTDASRLQQRILMCAKRDGGAVVPTTVAMHTGFDIDVVKEHLESLVDKGYAELQPSKDGTLMYVFPDMLTDERRNELELL